MQAQFDIILEDEGIDPKNIHDMPYIAVAKRHHEEPCMGSERSIVIVNPYGVTYIDTDGHCSYSDIEWFKNSYRIVSMDQEITLTFRN